MAVRKKGTRRAKGGAAAAGARTVSSATERRLMTAELRALAHPLRLRLFELFAEKPRTTMQVAELLGEPPTRLYHHVNALEKSGLLRLRETRPNRGTIEKYFEAVQPPVRASRAMLDTSEGRQAARAAVTTVFEQARQDLFAELQVLSEKRQPAPMVMRILLGLKPGKAVELGRRILQLAKELKEECGDAESASASAGKSTSKRRSADEERWSLTVAFARSWPPRKSEP